MECIAFTEAFARKGSGASADALLRLSLAAETQGWKLVPIPIEFGDELAQILLPLKIEGPRRLAIWIGFVPILERYEELYDAACQIGIDLIHTPQQYLLAQRWDHYGPFLGELGPRSLALTSVEECEDVVAQLGFPLFVRGTVQSRKHLGPAACIAEDLSSLLAISRATLADQVRSGGKVILRQYLRLRHTQHYNGLPQGREFRVFVFDRRILAWSYYWDRPDKWARLTQEEEGVILELAQTVATRLPQVRWIAVDLAQDQDGKWWVIEMGDAQFSGLCQVKPIALMGLLKAAFSSE